MITSIYNETYCDLSAAMPYLLNRYRAGKVIGDFSLTVLNYVESTCMSDSADCEGHTFADETDIVVELFAQANQLTLAHELVHVMQVLCGEKFNEVEAYALEGEICDILYTFRQ